MASQDLRTCSQGGQRQPTALSGTRPQFVEERRERSESRCIENPARLNEAARFELRPQMLGLV